MPPADEQLERAVRSFAAAMIAEAAHELNNRLATMHETVGLLEDLARAGASGAAGTARSHASLDDQVGRALNVVRTLGGLGGALGACAADFDAGAAIDDLLGLTSRWARRYSLRIDSTIAAGLPRAAGDPALFLCLAHRLLRQQAEMLPAGGILRLRVDRAGAGIGVHLAPAGQRPDTSAEGAADGDETNLALALRLGGRLAFEGGGALTIMLAAAR